MPSIDNYEILVIGSGGAGKFVAWTMAKAGRRTALIERRWLGGSCPNVACLPSKNLIYSAKVASLARRGAEFGLESTSLKIDMAAVQRRKRAMVEDLHQMHVDHQTASGAELIMGSAEFLDSSTVEIALNDGGTRRVTGERIFLGVGSRATMPEVPGLAAAHPMTHIEALDLDRLPQHLIVIGGGYVGLELAQAMRRFGPRVTVLQTGPQLAGREDADIGAALLELFKDEGIRCCSKPRFTGWKDTPGAAFRSTSRTARASGLSTAPTLVATGRRSELGRHGSGTGWSRLDQRGYIKVNERLETTAPNIWAMGDCAGSPHFTHVAYDDFRVVQANLTGGHRTTTNRLIPFCMFTDPELARVGLNEVEARHQGLEYRLATMPMAGVLRTWTVSDRRGFMKILVAKDSDQILGFTAFGFEASELMVAVQTAMIGRIPYTTLNEGIFTHPTAAEGLTELLDSVPPRNA